jgi:predicted DNA-binding protein
LFYRGFNTSSVICVRIPQELRERMKKFSNVNWSMLIRCFIEETISRLEAEELLSKIERDLVDVPELPEGSVSNWIRFDRCSY